MGRVKTFGDLDARSLEQLERCMAAGDAEFGVRRDCRSRGTMAGRDVRDPYRD
jgi:hypothetical protein